MKKKSIDELGCFNCIQICFVQIQNSFEIIYKLQTLYKMF